MALAAGARLGPYEIVTPLGAGGMGEVYRARDPRLDREVAVKILPAGVAGDPDRLRRFELEARAAGGLHHPNVLGILDVGTHEGTPFVVSELLEGETLRERLRISALPLKKALDLGVQVACGLAAAHAKGIVHRDLKPDNLFLTKDGRVKILDFGLAKLAPSPPSEDEATHTRSGDPITESGTILGTVGYMSPEQVRGLPVDHRSDIFSFGAVLYEMVSGERAFARETSAETMTAILKEDPPEIAAASVPPALDRVVRRCLEKAPDERFHSARDIAYAIEALSSSGPGGPSAASGVTLPIDVPVASRTARARRWAAVTAGLAVLLASGYLGRVASEPYAPSLGSYRFTPLATEPVFEGSPAWSPDGKTLAYVREVEGVLQVFTRGLAASMPAQITRAARDCRAPFWSPDGSRLFYVSVAGTEESLWAVGAAGGSPQVVLKNVSAAALSPDGQTLAFLRQDGAQGSFFMSLWISSPPGREPTQYAEPPLAGTRFPVGFLRFSPDGSKLALTAVALRGQASGPTQLWILPFPRGKPRLVATTDFPEAYSFAWLPDNRTIVFGDRRPRTPGLHLSISDTQTGGVQSLTATNGSETDPDVSSDGQRIAFTSLEEDYDLVEVPLDGAPLHTALATSRTEADPAWSPVGGQYAYVTDRAGSSEIWVRSRDGTFERALVAASAFDASPAMLLSSLAYSPDGQRIAYQRAESGRYRLWLSAVAGGPPVRLASIDESNYEDYPSWSPDGEWIAFSYMAQGKWGLAKARAGGGEKAVVIKEGIVYPSSPRWSPRGDWITCDTPEGFTVVSPDGARARVLTDETWLIHGWSRDGATIYALRQTEDLHLQLTSFDVATGRERLITADLGPLPPTTFPLKGFSLAPDGKSFLTSIVRLRGDIWLLEGYQAPSPFLPRLLAALRGTR